MKPLRAILTASLLVLVIAAPAGALVPRVPGDFKMSEGGEWPESSGEDAPPDWQLKWHNAPEVGDEDRGIFFVSDLTSVSPGAENFPNLNGRLVALFYDLEVIKIEPSGTDLDVWYGDAGRNPLAGRAAGTGGVIEIYEEESPGSDEDEFGEILDPSGPGTGPLQWDDDTGGRDAFPNVTDGSLWLSASFRQVGTVDGAPFFLRQTIDLTGADQPSFEALLETVGGNAFSHIKKDPGFPEDPLAEIRIAGSIAAPDVVGPAYSPLTTYGFSVADPANWQTRVEGDFDFTVNGDLPVAGTTLSASDGDLYRGTSDGATTIFTPEPGTAALVGLSLLALLSCRKKRR